ncbi:MAG: glycoside hydrolase family 9 protein [Phycisphaerae bacterium]|nr:glycoside hydrolase family 9 protein [Phycisphaerae bacterium]
MRSLLPSVLSLTVLANSGWAALWPSENLIDNYGFEMGKASKVTKWYLTSGEGAKNEYSFEPSAGKDGSRALKLGKIEGDFTLETGYRRLPPGSKSASFEVHVKLIDSSPVHIRIHWFSETGGSIVATSRSEPISGSRDWTRLAVTGDVPPGANWIRCAIRASDHSGVAFVDDACARTMTDVPPPLDVLCNQVGYAPSMPVKILVQSRADVTGGGTFRVIDASGKEVRRGKLSSAGSIPVWEKHYAVATVTGLPSAGGYRVEARAAGLTGTSYLFSVGADILRRKTVGPAAEFYYYQRCGCEVPGWHKACHMDDARLPDGTHKDVTGAWHDAGDYNKYNSCGFAALSVYALAYAHERAGKIMDEHARSKGVPSALKEAAWGADWLLKMQDEATGRLWGNVYMGRKKTALFWAPPEYETDNKPGTADDRPLLGRPKEGNHRNQGAAAALALLGRLTKNERYVQAAKRFYHAVTDAERNGELPFALIACLELEKALPSAGYAAEAKTHAQRLLDRQIQSGRYMGGFAHAPGGKTPNMGCTYLGLEAAALSLYALAHGDDLGIRKALMDYLSFSRRLADNPFKISKLVQGGEPVFFLSVPWGTHHVAQNTMYLMQAWALTCAWKFVKDDDFLSLATKQLDWVLGRNPFALCMMEGQGTFNPPVYHHRYFTIPGHHRGAVPGAVCNGIARRQPAPDKPLFDMRTNTIPQFETNEPWLPHNATYLLAVSSR